MAGKFPDLSQLMGGRGGGGGGAGGMPDLSQLMGGRGGGGGRGGAGAGGMPDLTQLMAARGGGVGGGAMPGMSQFTGGGLGGGAQDLLRKAQEFNDAVRRGDTEAMNRGVAEFSGVSNAAMRHTGGGVQTGPDPPRPSEEEQAQDPNALATWLQICLNNARLRGDHDRAEELEREQLAHCGQRHAEATAAAPPRSSAPTARSEELAKLDKLSADAQARGDIQEALKLRDLVIAKGQEYNGDMEGPATGVPGYIEPSNAPSGSSSQASPPPAPAPAPAPAAAPAAAAFAAAPPPPGSLPAPPPHAAGHTGKSKEKETEKAAAAHVDEVAEKMRGLQVDTATTTVPPQPAPVQSPLASSALPTGWSQHEDPKTGAVYFYNQSTGETSWNRPTGGAAAAASPPPPPPAAAVSSPPPSSAPSRSRPPRNWMRVSHSRVHLVDGVIIDLDLGKLIVAGPAGRRIKMKCFNYSPGMVANPYSQSGGSGSEPERPKPTEFKSMQGYLVKLSHRKSIFNNEVWQKRYFVLDKNQIKYYKNDRLGKAKGTIPLQAGGWACAVEKGQDRRKDAFAFKDQYSMRKMLTANVGSMMSEYDGHITKDHCLAVHHPQGKTMDLNSIMEKNVFQLAAANKSQQKNTARTFYLLADSDRQRDEWLEAIDNNLVFACTAEGSEQVGSAGGSSGPEHPNPAIDRLIGVIRMAGGDPSLTDVEGVVQELTGLYPE